MYVVSKVGLQPWGKPVPEPPKWADTRALCTPVSSSLVLILLVEILLWSVSLLVLIILWYASWEIKILVHTRYILELTRTNPKLASSEGTVPSMLGENTKANFSINTSSNGTCYRHIGQSESRDNESGI